MESSTTGGGSDWAGVAASNPKEQTSGGGRPGAVPAGQAAGVEVLRLCCALLVAVLGADGDAAAPAAPQLGDDAGCPGFPGDVGVAGPLVWDHQRDAGHPGVLGRRAAA